MYTAVLAFALSAVAASDPVWLDDYSQAKQQAKNEKKPIAVFVGTGEAGWEKFVREGKLTSDVRTVLAQKYICVYVDRTQNEKLATALEMTGKTGLVLSDAGGQIQAFRHEGQLDDGDLLTYLRRYADPERKVLETEKATERRTSHYPPTPQYAPSVPMGGGC